MSNNSEKMSKVIDLLTESLVELRAISSSDGEFTSEQVLKIVRHAYVEVDLVESDLQKIIDEASL